MAAEDAASSGEPSDTEVRVDRGPAASSSEATLVAATATTGVVEVLVVVGGAQFLKRSSNWTSHDFH